MTYISVQRPVFAGLRIFKEPGNLQTWYSHPKVPPEDLYRGFLCPKKSISIGFDLANLDAGTLPRERRGRLSSLNLRLFFLPFILQKKRVIIILLT